MKKIIFLCHGAGNGGAERVITTLANEFSKKNYQVFLITTNKDKNDYKINSKVQRNRIISNMPNSVLRTLDRLRKLRKLFKHIKPDYIVSFSAIPNMQAIISNIGLKSKLIISERTDPSKYPASKIGRMLRTILYPIADQIVFQTKDAQDFFQNNIKRKSKIIPNPIRDDLPKNYTGIREKVIVGIGSLGKQKNWQMALNASKIFFQNYPDYQLHIYGEGPERDSLQKKINCDEILKNRVILKGFHADAVEQMAKATMFISSSNYEGISNSMLEALAVGTPTICTDCPVGGARMVIDSGINGILVPVGDYQALASEMISIVKDPEYAKSLSQNAQDIKTKLQLSTIVTEWENLMQ